MHETRFVHNLFLEIWHLGATCLFNTAKSFKVISTMAVKTVVLPFVVVIVAIIASVSLLAPRQRIPDHMINHTLIEAPNFFTEKEVDDLLQFTRDMKEILPLGREYDEYTTLTDNVGEAVPYVKGQPCPRYLIPNGNKTMCVFAGRIDVARHFIITGGASAMKERYETLVSRIFAFVRHIPVTEEGMPDLPKRLLTAAKFQELVTGVCPKDKQLVEPIQMTMLAQLPGQTVATHIDAPYFQRVSRYHYPVWLLSVMMWSGLFQKDFIDQVQIVAYYHKWTDTNRRGRFKFWNNRDSVPAESSPISGSANAVDGSKVVHAADVYMPDSLPPRMPDTSTNILRYRKGAKGEHLWDLVSDEQFIKTFQEDEIRFAMGCRALCFATKKDIEKYHEDQKNPMPLEQIMETFRKDLVKKGLMVEGHEVKMRPYDFAVLLLDTYVKYPMSPTALIPYNWCVLDRVFKWLTPVVELLCNYDLWMRIERGLGR